MKSSRRHDSLIPLSREHQYALLLCLRIHRGLPRYGDNQDWLEAKAEQSIKFFESDLIPHFKAEEEILFPAMMGFSDAPQLIDELMSEHRSLNGIIEQLRRLKDKSIAIPLGKFADTLEAHIRKEERQLFPLYERQVSAQPAERVGREIQKRIGDASQPRHPELLK